MQTVVNVEWFTPHGNGFEAFVETFTGFGEKMSNWSSFFTEVATEVLEPAHSQQFSSQGAFGGTPWKPLAPATIKKRQRGLLPSHGREGMQILAGGPLERSFRRGGEGHIEVIEPLRMIWGSGLTSSHSGYNIGVMHHFGKGRNPVREILVMTPDMIRSIRERASKFVAESAREAGFGSGVQEPLSFVWSPLPNPVPSTVIPRIITTSD
jgi:hypothetical protein